MKKLNIREVQVDFKGLDQETIDEITQITRSNGELVEFTGIRSNIATVREFSTYFRYHDSNRDFNCYRKNNRLTTITPKEFIKTFSNIKGFIELTKAGSDERMLLNYNNFTFSENEGRVLILSNNERRTPICVKESYEEIKSMIIQNQKS